MAEWTGITVQTVNPGESVVFTANPVPCRRGFVRHREDSGSFLLSGYVPGNSCDCGCGCGRNQSATYLASVGLNIAIPTGGTVGEISVALALDGATLPATTMRTTPAAVNQYASVSRTANVEVWKGCCQTLTVRNTSTQPILVAERVIDFSRPDLAVTR